MDGQTIPAPAPFLHFAEVAERLADNGYSPLPIKPGSKRVVERDWTRFCLAPVNDATMCRWLVIAHRVDEGLASQAGI